MAEADGAQPFSYPPAAARPVTYTVGRVGICFATSDWTAQIQALALGLGAAMPSGAFHLEAGRPFGVCTWSPLAASVSNVGDNAMLRALLRPWIRIDASEISCKKRGFSVDHPPMREHLERIGSAFIAGYDAWLDGDLGRNAIPSSLETLDNLPAEHRGFAYEGAGMAAALVNPLSPRGGGFRELVDARPEHCYLCYVGLGWAWARFHRRRAQPPAWSDPLLGWLAFDGQGFHEGFFQPERAFREPSTIRTGSSAAQRIFDQGLGRSLWFVCGGHPEKIAGTIKNMAPNRHGDLWSGLGLALAYAGYAQGQSDAKEQIAKIGQAAGSFLAQLGQGISFAAKARLSAGHVPEHTELACQLVLNCDAERAAQVTDACRQRILRENSSNIYLCWQSAIMSTLGTLMPTPGKQSSHLATERV